MRALLSPDAHTYPNLAVGYIPPAATIYTVLAFLSDRVLLPLAHQPAAPSPLPLSPPILASCAALVVLAVLGLWPGPAGDRGVGGAGHVPGRPIESWAGRLSAAQVAGRAVGVAVLALAVTAGRIGVDRELHNIASALVMGVTWPLLLAGSALFGPLWRWLDPWDGLARAMERGSVASGGGVVGAPSIFGPGNPSGLRGDGGPAGDVRPAVISALAWLWYLTVYPHSLSPRAVGLAVALYTIGTLAGCLSLGRAEWLSRAEVFGLLFGWIGRLPRRQLRWWDPPRGAELVLGVLAGGLLFGAVRRSHVWDGLRASQQATVWAGAGLVAFAVALGAAAWAAGRSRTDRASRGAVAAAMVPAVASLGVALAMSGGRLVNSLQLLPRLASDPLGRGWDLFGTARTGMVDPLPELALAGVQVSVLVAGHLAGAVVHAHRAPSRGRGRGAALLAASVWLGVFAVTDV